MQTVFRLVYQKWCCDRQRPWVVFLTHHPLCLMQTSCKATSHRLCVHWAVVVVAFLPCSLSIVFAAVPLTIETGPGLTHYDFIYPNDPEDDHGFEHLIDYFALVFCSASLFICMWLPLFFIISQDFILYSGYKLLFIVVLQMSFFSLFASIPVCVSSMAFDY